MYYTTKPDGRGLGLPFALRAIELKGGKLEIQSQVGKGTVCKIALPAVQNDPVKPDAIDGA
jgi:signal transduction histidine kinase